MKSLSCKDLGSPICDVTVISETAEEAVKKMMAHAKMAHPDNVKMMSEADMRKMMASKVKDA